MFERDGEVRPSVRSLCARKTAMERRITLDGTNTMKYHRAHRAERQRGAEAGRPARTTVPLHKQTLQRDCGDEYA